MFPILAIILILLAIILIVAVLLQPGKGDISATFGGISGQFGAMFGMQRTADFLAKFTRVIAIIILLLCLLTNKFFVSGDHTEKIKPVTEGARVPASATAPAQKAPVQQPQQQPAPAQQK